VGENFNDFISIICLFTINAQKRGSKKYERTCAQRPNEPFTSGRCRFWENNCGFYEHALALDNGFQACLMAPTEILANQHFIGLSELAQTLNINIRIQRVLQK
jgi:ATP-dependent DNA helicase RecG